MKVCVLKKVLYDMYMYTKLIKWIKVCERFTYLRRVPLVVCLCGIIDKFYMYEGKLMRLLAVYNYSFMFNIPPGRGCQWEGWEQVLACR